MKTKNRLSQLFARYPRQFWIMFFGMTISTVGASMIWPFLMLYVSDTLHVPLATVGGLATLNAVVGLMAAFIGGPITDRLGRKGVMVFSYETLPAETSRVRPNIFGGYDTVVRDRRFMSFVGAFALTQMCPTLIWMLMAVYAKHSFGVPESLYGLIPTTNALMVVFLQVVVTQFTKKRPPMRMMALGAFFFAMGVGSVVLARGFTGFLISMVILTVGELIIMPTSSVFVAALAPADMRGRYMSVFGLSLSAAQGVAPVMGGALSDTLGPVTTWYGGLVVGLPAVAWFLAQHRRGLSVSREASR